MSAELSAGVPMNKCFGFTHGGLSHLCRTFIPTGIFVLCNSQENLCAGTAFLCSMNSLPYPPIFLVPDQCQHPLLLTTFLQKRIIGSVLVIVTYFFAAASTNATHLS